MFQYHLIYKASLKGITVIETEESYTSKCSFFDNEFPCKQESYLGERVFRGLFKSSKGFINADLNGALNIIKKVYKDFCCETANLNIDFFRLGVVDKGLSFKFLCCFETYKPLRLNFIS